ncbi:type II secretion system F family protein [Corynebacterium pseudopelargi]|uniref:Bacterial type II secretion system protein F domain protein n=1 Tax=Corynebacterium pseudopelargi TaxID=2080757 RepID=A0A3G6IWL0_9CORY|nr:type II secretion system F family protein [Corynebacterium pseudopelargi]AZA10171.1 Bacterial type II secretion system protein F domain protein [Corynebacterium pseudopelargi]
MSLLSMASVAGAIACYGPSPARRIRQAAQGRTTRAVRTVLIAAGLVALAVLFRHALVLISFAIAVLVGLRIWRDTAALRKQRREEASIAAIVHTISTELRVGADPATALAHAAEQERESGIAAAFASAARATRSGAQPGAQLHAMAQHYPALAPIARYWMIAEEHGVALAPLLEQSHRQLRARLERTRSTNAALQGPKATAIILSLLPLVGMLLGSAMGVNVPSVLLGNALGNLLLLIGVSLLSAGAWWSNKIIQGATP